MTPWPDPCRFPPPSPLFPLPPRAVLDRFKHDHPEAIEQLLSEADSILAGQFRFFSNHTLNLGMPPAWNREGATYVHSVKGRHWTQVLAKEDIKLVWELSRFGWGQVLARAYAFSTDEKYADCFWVLLEDWMAQNPPNQGPQWMCGQEVALRSISLAFSDALLAQAHASTPERRAALHQMIQAGAARIAPYIHYARSQKNNHSLNEALGLLTAATFDSASPRTGAFRNLGNKIFDADLTAQVDPEGSYIQHSVVYHRVLLQACAWRHLLSRKEGEEWPRATEDRIAAALDWMLSMTAPLNGEAPNLGSNDGSDNLRWSASAFGDQRPTLQLLSTLMGRPLPFPPGPWDEPIIWATGRAPHTFPRSPYQRKDLNATRRGHFTRCYDDGFLYFRCSEYRDRPSQSDPLHVDLTWRGINVLCDAGTYRYNAPPPWRNALASTRVHNTVTLDGKSSMERLGSFLWLDWDQARLISPVGAPLVGERIPTKAFPARHRRSILPIGSSAWLILDDVLCVRPASIRLHWLLPMEAWEFNPHGCTLNHDGHIFQLSCLGPGALGVAHGVPHPHGTPPPSSVDGWRSVSYDTLEPAFSLSLLSPPTRQVRWLTLAGEGPFEVEDSATHLKVASPLGHWEVPKPPIPGRNDG